MKSKRRNRIRPVEYDVWSQMKARCRNKNHPNYGGRGIKVCERWEKFANFYADMGPRPKDMQLDRIDNDGDYEPSNCRWASARENANNRRGTVYIEFGGLTLSKSNWARKFNIPVTTFSRLIREGLTIAEILVRPPARKSRFQEKLRAAQQRKMTKD